MRRWLLFVALSVAWVVIVGQIHHEPAAGASTPDEALAACSGANAVYQACTTYSPTELRITLANPASGATYDYVDDGHGGWIEPGNQIVVPDGYCYRIESIAVHITTSGAPNARNLKVVERDRSDPDPPGGGNRGVQMGPGANGILAYDYVDTEFAPNGSGVFTQIAAGTITNIKRYNMGGWIPDICVEPGDTIGIDTFGMAPLDQESEFKALVEWQQVP